MARASKPPRAFQRMLSGRRLDLLDPSPLDVEIEDIAHGLARVARWNGQTSGPHIFSVAQHSALVERIVAIHGRGPLPGPGADILAGERPLGRLGSSAGGRGVALVRLDRVREALDARMPLRAGSEEVDVAIPAWASYGWPAASAEGEGG